MSWANLKPTQDPLYKTRTRRWFVSQLTNWISYIKWPGFNFIATDFQV